MQYRAIGIMSGSSLDGLDIAFVEFLEQAGKWAFRIEKTACYPYNKDWQDKLKKANLLSALEYQLLHTEYGHYIGQKINEFIETNHLQYQVSLISSHGHTVFHVPSKKMTAQIGDGAAIAALTQLPVVSDLRAMDVALGGQGAPIVPIGEKILLPDYNYYLNIGGIANISSSVGKAPEATVAFDICPANRVLNMLANETGKEFDNEGSMARSGKIDMELLEKLNALDYYQKAPPKSLANDFGTDTVYPMIKDSRISIPDALRTYIEHIAIQVSNAISTLVDSGLRTPNSRLLSTGGGSFNKHLIELIRDKLNEIDIELDIPDDNLVIYKEAMIMAFIGVLRWRQEVNVLSSVTGAQYDSIGGALWNGQEA